MATSIGSIVVDLQANTAQFRNDLEKANGATKKFGGDVAHSTGRVSASFQQIAQASRNLGNAVANNISPAASEAANAIGLLGTTLSKLPIAASIAVAGLAAAAIAVQRLATELNKTQEEQSKLFLALQSGDVSGLQAQLKALGESFDILRRQQINAGDLVPKIKAGDIRGSLESLVNALQFGFSKGLDDIRSKAEAVGKALRELVPIQVQAELAAYNASLQRSVASSQQFFATLAEGVNDEKAFTSAIDRAIVSIKEEARRIDESNRIKAEEALRKSRGDSLLSADARAADEEKITAELKHQLDLTGEKLRLEIDQLRERRRTGVLGIRERIQAPFGPEPGIEDAARSEGLAAGITPDPETMQRAREAVRGVEKDIDDLHTAYKLLGRDVDVIGGEMSLQLTEMGRLISVGVGRTDEKLQERAERFKSLGSAGVIRDLRQSLENISGQAEIFGKGFDSAAARVDAFRTAIVALRERGISPTSEAIRDLSAEFDQAQIEDLTSQLDRQQETFLMTDRALAIYAAQLKLSADASDELKAKTADLAGKMFDLQDQQRLVNDAVSIGVSAATQLGDALYDTLTGQSESFEEGIKRIIHAINKMILTMIIAELVARALKAAISGIAGGAGDTGSSVGAAGGIGTADITRGAKGGVVKHRPGGKLMIVGEAGADEAIIPLDRMNALGGGGQQSGPLVEVHIENHGANVEQKSSTGADGRQIERFIISTVEGGLNRGAFDNAGKGLGWRRQPAQR